MVFASQKVPVLVLESWSFPVVAALVIADAASAAGYADVT